MLGLIFFTTIFLTVNHFHPIFALPPVSKDNVSTGQSLSLTHVLAKRVWTPPDQTCNEPEDWDARHCVAAAVDKIWYDSCIDAEGDVSYGWGICPDTTICMNVYGPEPDQAPTIACVYRPSCDSCRPTIAAGPPPASGQTGMHLFGAWNIRPQILRFQVIMDKSISGASVTAFIEGTYQTFQPTLTC